MKKGIILLVAVILTGGSFIKISHSETLEQLKARLKSQVRQELGVNSTRAQRTTPTAQLRERQISSLETSQKGTPVVVSAVISVLGLDNVDPIIAQKVVFILLLLSILPAVIAKIKGRSFIAWWILSVLFFVIVFPAVFFIKKTKSVSVKKKASKKKKQKEASRKEDIKAVLPVKASGESPMQEENSAISIYGQIEHLAKLKERGLITDEEFSEKKHELLSRI